jgi:hypothetical protein
MTYAERKNKFDPKPATMPMRNIGEERRRLWDALNQFIHQQGAAVVSMPNRWPVRVEVTRESSLPVKFQELGYIALHVGQTMRDDAVRLLRK